MTLLHKIAHNLEPGCKRKSTASVTKVINATSPSHIQSSAIQTNKRAGNHEFIRADRSRVDVVVCVVQRKV